MSRHKHNVPIISPTTHNTSCIIYAYFDSESSFSMFSDPLLLIQVTLTKGSVHTILSTVDSLELKSFIYDLLFRPPSCSYHKLKTTFPPSRIQPHHSQLQLQPLQFTENTVLLQYHGCHLKENLWTSCG